MTALRKALLLSLLLSGTVIAAGVSAEQDTNQQHPMGRHVYGGSQGQGMHNWRHGPGMPMMRLLRGLELSDEQKAEIEAIMKDSKDQMRAIWSAAHDDRQALMEMVRTGDIDEEELRRLADELGNYHADSIVMHAHTQSAVRSVLTPAQRDELDKKLDTVRELKPGRRGFFQDDA
jgi:protein CpxP